jgi:hypothetical protein
MADLNRQRVERNHVIAVTLISGQNRASVFVRQPAGGGQNPSFVDLARYSALKLAVVQGRIF